MLITETPNLATSLTGALLNLEKIFLNQQVEIESWFRQQWQKTRSPFYGSVDLRNAGFKLAPIDTNLFPAGFNNLNPDLMPLSVQATQATMAEICPNATNLLIIPESHSRNLFYFESLAVLNEILQAAGFATRIGSLDDTLKDKVTHELASGRSITLEPLIREGDRVGVAGFFPCCVVLNNDLSGGMPDILKNLQQTIMPSTQLGWGMRLKSAHFRFYEEVSEEFANLVKIDPWLITPDFDQCPEVDFMKREGQQCLMDRAASLLKRIQRKYQEHQIDQQPFLIVKADAGTYGMAVMTIKDPQELLELNRKQRSHMSKAKGGARVTKALIQEGVYTFETIGQQGAVAEPVVYMIGRHVVGGFYRVHSNRGRDENLNSPGMNFEPLAFAKSCSSPEKTLHNGNHANRFYAYGVVARLAFLAAARELAELNLAADRV